MGRADFYPMIVADPRSHIRLRLYKPPEALEIEVVLHSASRTIRHSSNASIIHFSSFLISYLLLPISHKSTKVPAPEVPPSLQTSKTNTPQHSQQPNAQSFAQHVVPPSKDDALHTRSQTSKENLNAHHANMQFQSAYLLVVTALLTTNIVAFPMPKPHLNLDAVKDVFLHGKREAAPASGLNVANFLQEKATTSPSSSTPNYAGMGDTSGLCMGSDNACVTGGGQITK